MGYRITIRANDEPPADQQQAFDQLKQEYDGRYVETAEELSKISREINQRLRGIYMKPIPQSDYRYASHSVVVLTTAVKDMISFADSTEEQERWQGIFNEMTAVIDRCYDEKEEPPAEIDLKTDDFIKEATPDFLQEKQTVVIDDFLKKVIPQMQEAVDRAKLKIPNRELSVDHEMSLDEYRIYSMENCIRKLRYALGHTMEDEWSREDEYRLNLSYGGWVPNVQYVVKESQELMGAGSRDTQRYVRLEGVLPIRTISARALQSLELIRDFEAKKEKSPEDELAVRRRLLSDCVEMERGIEKCYRNMNDERVRNLFPVETEEAMVDLVGNRSSFPTYRSISRARRGMIKNGWAIKEISEVGRLCSMVEYIQRKIERGDGNWTPEGVNAIEKVRAAMERVISGVHRSEAGRTQMLTDLLRAFEDAEPYLGSYDIEFADYASATALAGKTKPFYKKKHGLFK